VKCFTSENCANKQFDIYIYIYIYIYIHTYMSQVHKYFAPGRRGNKNFIEWLLIFVQILSREFGSRHPYCAYISEVAPRFLESFAFLTMYI
jgi:hypothetical protein